MEKGKIQLGRGMAALLKSQPNLENNNETQFDSSQSWLVDISKIITNKDQPRKIFKDKELQELTISIKENGIIQPLIVSEKEGMFELIAGERRLRAAKLAGLEKVPVVVKRATKKDAVVMSIIENVQRSDLNCVEEGLAYFQLMNNFNLTQEEVAQKIGKDRSTVANLLRILKLPKEILLMLQKEMLSFGHAKILCGLSDDESIKRMGHVAVNDKLSVRELEELIKKTPKKLKAKTNNKFYEDQFAQLQKRLQDKTQFHVNIKGKKNGAGQILINFNNEAEFNDIFKYLMQK